MAETEISYSGPLVTRADARAAGLKRFFTGEPCRYGHIAQRHVSTGGCKACHFNQIRQRRLRDMAAARERDRAWRAANREKERQRLREWRLANLEELRQRDRDRRVLKPEQTRAYDHNRRARKRASPGQHTAADIRALHVLQKGKCAYCRISLKAGFHVDHIMPLAKGGSNDRTNIQLLCKPCNLSKGAKHPIEFARVLGRLL